MLKEILAHPERLQFFVRVFFAPEETMMFNELDSLYYYPKLCDRVFGDVSDVAVPEVVARQAAQTYASKLRRESRRCL